MFRRDQPAVTVGLCTWLACTKLAPDPRRSAAGWTADSEYVFRSEFFFHNGKMMAQIDEQEMVNCEQFSQSFLPGEAGTTFQRPGDLWNGFLEESQFAHRVIL
jgi:hypothetical protein